MTPNNFLQKIPQERQIIFIGSSIWTRFVGWYQVLRSSVAIIILLAKSGESLEAQESLLLFSPEVKVNNIMSLNMLMYLMVELNMGIGLLRGSYGKNIHLIRAWMVFATFGAFIFPSCVVSDWILDGNNSETGAYEIVSAAMSLPAEAFLVWVVGIHKKEIGASIGLKG